LTGAQVSGLSITSCV